MVRLFETSKPGLNSFWFLFFWSALDYIIGANVGGSCVQAIRFLEIVNNLYQFLRINISRILIFRDFLSYISNLIQVYL